MTRFSGSSPSNESNGYIYGYPAWPQLTPWQEYQYWASRRRVMEGAKVDEWGREERPTVNLSGILVLAFMTMILGFWCWRR